MTTDKLRLFAKRGASNVAPENTMAAFIKCLELNVDWFEFDVQMAGDSSIVVMHDSTVDRTTDGTGKVSEMSFAQLRRLDAGKWFAPQFRLERIPELTTVIDLLNNSALSANIEIKPEFGSAARRSQIISAVSASLRHLEDPTKILISSFQPEILARIKESNPEYARALVVEREPLRSDLTGIIELAKELECQAVHPENTGLQPGQVEELRAADLQVNVWTVDDPKRADEIQQWGVTGIFTTEPQEMAAALN